MNKVYLVSYIQCWNDQAMDKNFQLFNTKEDAVAYKAEGIVDLELDDIDIEEI